MKGILCFHIPDGPRVSYRRLQRRQRLFTSRDLISWTNTANQIPWSDTRQWAFLKIIHIKEVQGLTTIMWQLQAAMESSSALRISTQVWTNNSIRYPTLICAFLVWGKQKGKGDVWCGAQNMSEIVLSQHCSSSSYRFRIHTKLHKCAGYWSLLSNKRRT